MKKAGVFTLVIFAVALLAIFLSFLYLKLDEGAAFGAQKERLAALRTSIAAPSGSLAADRALPDSTPFDRVRYLATHNSYRRRGSALGLFLIGLAKPEEPAKLGYSHPPLWEQLESGIRSFELDLRPRGDGFVLRHVPLLDTRTAVPDFALALEEIALWSERNPGHAPIVALLELKEDYSFLEPELGHFDEAAMRRLDAAVRQGLGSRLFAASEMGALAEHAAGEPRGWPALGALRGRVIVVLHENEGLRAAYEAGLAPELRALFTCLPGGRGESAFAILNDPVADAEAIRAAVSRGVIVRTRADADLDARAEILRAALESGAQLVSTDFPPGHEGPQGYMAALPGGTILGIRP